jgi:RimJ/RimL family protein N-acetyltransferase
MAHILLATERLILRRFTENDLDHLFQLDNDPQVMRWINGGRPVSRQVIRSEILPTFLTYDSRHPAFGFWAAIDKNGGGFHGWFSLRPTGTRVGDALLGYRLRRAAWGQGYATEGVRALINIAFSAPGVQRIVATTYEKNLASRRVLEKAGLTLIRRFRLTPADLQQADTFHTDSLAVWDGYDLEYALEKSAWQASLS